ncbi:MAG: nuclear transport factor 2 family protein [Mucilaginibacter sp.]|nr:nuclear transport factor 2 family protein [Mucilaginibacter sp.]
MKTVKTMLMGLALLFAFGTAGAATPSGSKPTKDDVFNTYLNAIVHGKLNGIDDAIDNDAEFNYIRGDNVNRITKQQVINALKSDENVEQNCQCTRSVVQDSDDLSTLKVEMKYAGFTRVDVITAQRAGNGWKITKVDTSYK